MLTAAGPESCTRRSSRGAAALSFAAGRSRELPTAAAWSGRAAEAAPGFLRARSASRASLIFAAAMSSAEEGSCPVAAGGGGWEVARALAGAREAVTLSFRARLSCCPNT